MKLKNSEGISLPEPNSYLNKVFVSRGWTSFIMISGLEKLFL